MNVVAKLYADGRTEECNVRMSLQELQEFVGGNIEMVRCRLYHRALIVNDAGLLDNLPRNEAATELCHPHVLHYGIRGNALLVKI